MASSKRSVPPDDEIERTLREAARRKRRGSPLLLLLILFVLVGPLVLFAWWTWPEGDPPNLTIVAGDQLAAPGEEVSLSAFLVPTEPITRKPRLTGYDISFEESAAGPAGKNLTQRQQVQSQADGSATAPWRCPEKSGTVEIMARYRGDKKRRVEDRARLFVWPADSPLLLVDVPAVVSPLPASGWHAKNIPNILPRPEAAKVLQAAQAKKYRIVYLAIEPADAITYRKCREWIMNKAFPPGPVLGRSNYELDAAAAWEETLKDIKQRFRGPVLAVVGSNEIATACRSLGIRTFDIPGKLLDHLHAK